MVVKDKKLIVNIQASELDNLEKAAKKENRTRNNFVISSALEKADKILKENHEGNN